MNEETDDLWFTEDLIVREPVEEPPDKGTHEDQAIGSRARVEVRVNNPRWRFLSEAERSDPFINARSTIILVRLGFQFAVPLWLREKGYKIVWARCSAIVTGRGSVLARVVDLFPKDLYEGSVRQMRIDLNPKLKFGSVEASVGSASGTVDVGRVQARVVGYAGPEERAPYWEISPKGEELIGTRDFWLLLEAPLGCTEVGLSVKIEAECQHRFGFIPLGPRDERWEKRPRISIPISSG